MRLLLLAGLAATLLPLPGLAQYRSTCSTDFLGNTSCRDSNGGRIRINEDPFGNINSTYSDGYGNSTRCRTSTDFLGNVTTRCY